MSTVLKAAIAGTVFALIFSCSQIKSATDHANAWVGRSVYDYSSMVNRKGAYANSIGWQEKTYQLPNGNKVYVFPASPECYIHFEVDREGTIIGSRTEGKRCD